MDSDDDTPVVRTDDMQRVTDQMLKTLAVAGTQPTAWLQCYFRLPSGAVHRAYICSVPQPRCPNVVVAKSPVFISY